MSATGPRRRGEAFGSIIAAAGYEAVRPGYPAEAVSWLLGDPRTPLRVLDLGAGTGKLTRALVGGGHRVVAVDPAETMLRTLSAAVPGVETRVGRGEAVPLPDGDVDAVVIGQAWHWMDPDAAGAEIRRVLRPGGCFGVTWNVPDLRRGWVAELETAHHPRRRQHALGGHRGRRVAARPCGIRPAAPRRVRQPAHPAP